MNEALRQWIGRELEDYTPRFKAFNRRLMKRVPIWMALCVIGMVALGFGVGYEWQYVMKVHLLIGLGLAAFIWLCFWIQTRSTSMKKVQRMFDEALSKLSPSDQEALARQAHIGRADFANSAVDKYPARLIVGPDYWVYFRDSCHVFKVSDMQGLKVIEETGRIGYNMGSKRVRQTIGMGDRKSVV